MKSVCIGAGISLFVLSFSLCLAAEKVVVVPLGDGGSGIPKGAVMYFNLDSCPDGWSPVAEGQGRVLVGIPPAGNRGVTVGAPLSDGGNRLITDVPSHQHMVDPASFSTSITEGGHTHSFRIENMVSFGDYAVAGSENNAGGEVFQLYESGTHSHHINVPATSTSATGSVEADVTMPYLQLLICEKE